MYSIYQKYVWTGLVIHTCNLGTQEGKAGGPLWLWGQYGLHSKFQDSYLVRPCVNKTEKKKKKETK